MDLWLSSKHFNITKYKAFGLSFNLPKHHSHKKKLPLTMAMDDTVCIAGLVFAFQGFLTSSSFWQARFWQWIHHSWQINLRYFNKTQWVVHVAHPNHPKSECGTYVFMITTIFENKLVSKVSKWTVKNIQDLNRRISLLFGFYGWNYSSNLLSHCVSNRLQQEETLKIVLGFDLLANQLKTIWRRCELKRIDV